MRKRKKVVVTTFAIVSDFHTDRFLHEAHVKDLNDGVLDNTVLKTSEKHGNFRKLCRSLKVENGVLMYKGQRNEYPPVPIPEQVGNLLYKVHIRDWKKGKNVGKTELYRGVQLHIVAALSEARVAYPAALGGLKALAEEWVHHLVKSWVFL